MSRVPFRTTTVFACVLAFIMIVAAGCSGSGSQGDPTTTDVVSQPAGGQTLLMYAGSASKPPTDEAIQQFKQKTGITVEVNYGGSGTVLSQMKLAQEGDLYFPGSSDYMEKAKHDGDVISATEARVAYLVPAINVQAGNPKNIQGLADLVRSDVDVAIANPASVCVGLYAVEIIERAFSDAEKAAFRANLLNYTDSCEKTATAIALKQVDAVLGWSVFQEWNPEAIETVALPASQVPRVGYIPIAVSSYTENQSAAQQFIDFLTGEEGRAIFTKFGYFTTAEQAFEYVGEQKPVGGEYPLPADWVAE